MNKKKERHRIIKKNNYILISNLKCGYTSINMLKDITVNPSITKKNKVILNYRDIYRRNISVFLNWCIARCELNSWLMDIMKSILPEKKYESFYDGCKKKYLRHSYKIFLDNLDKIYMLNHHTHPQVQILKDHNIVRIDYFINIDYDQHIKILNILINDKLPVSDNKSDDSQKIFLLDFLKEETKYRNIIENVYKEDILFFKNNKIDVTKFSL